MFWSNPGSSTQQNTSGCGYLSPILQTIQIIRRRHVWWSKNVLISDGFLWTTKYGHTSVDRPAKTFIDHLYVDPGRCVEDLPRAMTDRDGWPKRLKESVLSIRLNDDHTHTHTLTYVKTCFTVSISRAMQTVIFIFVVSITT